MGKKYTRRRILEYAGKIGLTGMSGSVMTGSLRGWLPDGVSISVFDDTVDKVTGYANSVKKGADATSKALEDFTPEQEYYIGRTVGAVVLDKYKPFSDTVLNNYLNVVGQTLAQASDMPETFNGYHLLALDSTDINAFATPSGLVFLTRGMLRCCQDEGELAAILAHEVGHVQLKHGINSIEKGRITEAVMIIGSEATKTFAEGDIARLTENFEDSINDIATTMINNGYSRSFEEDADAAALTILERVGYNPVSLINMLEVMNTKLKPEGLDFAKTHPSPSSRIEYVSEIIQSKTDPTFSNVQVNRFNEAMKNV